MTETRCRLRDGMGRYREVTHEQLPERCKWAADRKITVIGQALQGRAPEMVCRGSLRQ